MFYENPTISDPNSPVTFGQGKLIAIACGGIKKICPAYEEGDSSAAALTAMGLTKGKASDVIEELERQGLKKANFDDAESARKATEILNRIGGISCRVPSARRSTGSQAAAGARTRGGATLSAEGFPELDITALMLGRGMTREQAIRFLQLMGGR